MTITFCLFSCYAAKLNKDSQIQPAENIKKENISETTVVQNTVTSPYSQVVSNTVELFEAISKIPPQGGTITIKAGIYLINREIHINRSNVTLKGEKGVLFELNKNADVPVILIGTNKETPTKDDVIKNIKISDIEINGLMKYQSSELVKGKPWIRNNGIDIRAVDNLWVDNVDIYNCRSGGIVASWHSSRIFITNSSFHNNFFDGIALYDSEDIHISNVNCYGNVGAGVSLDNNLRDVLFNGGIIKNNRDVGIFVRDSENIAFHNLQISNNGNSGCFMAHSVYGSTNEIIPNSGVKRLYFQGCRFIGNKGYGIALASEKDMSPGNSVVSCLFTDNKYGAINDPHDIINKVSNIYQK